MACESSRWDHPLPLDQAGLFFGFAGRFEKSDVPAYDACVLGTLVGIFLGLWLSKYIDQALFKRIALVMVLFGSALLIFNGTSYRVEAVCAVLFAVLAVVLVYIVYRVCVCLWKSDENELVLYDAEAEAGQLMPNKRDGGGPYILDQVSVNGTSVNSAPSGAASIHSVVV